MTASSYQQSSNTLTLVAELCQELLKESILYCHWKSNVALERSASGDNDLDLLISRADFARFTEVLSRLGIKEARAPRPQGLPGVLDYYGYDKDVGRLVHVHAHYQLVLGHDRTKNFRLPIEEPFLASATQRSLFMVPTLEFEFIVFVLRMVMKYSSWDAVVGRQGTLRSSDRDELEFLLARIKWADAYDRLDQHLPFISRGLFDGCVRSLRMDSKALNRIRVGGELRRRLQSCSRRPESMDISLRLWRRVGRGVRRRLYGSLPKKRLTGGGAMIALVGGDGAGKSTAGDALHAWLSKDFDTMKVHLGRPRWSWTTYTVRAVGRVASLLGGAPRGKPVDPLSVMASGAVRRCAWMLAQVCLARDRYRLYLRARRYATNGGLVICDRFPLSQVKQMDGPQIERMLDGGETSRLAKFLAKREKSWYSLIAKPDLLILLKVAPETAVQRKTNEDPDSVRVRSQEIWELDWRHTSAHVVDASPSESDVHLELKSLIWSQL